MQYSSAVATHPLERRQGRSELLPTCLLVVELFGAAAMHEVTARTHNAVRSVGAAFKAL